MAVRNFVAVLMGMTLAIAGVCADTIVWVGAANASWDDASSWTNTTAATSDRVPIAGDAAVVNNGSIAQVSTAVAGVPNAVRIGNSVAGPGTVNVTGGSLSANFTQISTANGATGTLNVTDGSYSAGTLQLAANNGSVAAGTEGSIFISGGAFSFGAGTIGTAGSGTFGITGTDASSIQGNNLTFGADSTFSLTLGPAGIDQLTINNLLTINSSASLFIDASAYTGPAATITLADAVQPLSGTFQAGNITIVGGSGSVSQDVGNGLIQLNIVPEPTSLALTALGAALLGFRRRFIRG